MSEQPFGFKENILTRSVVSLLFGLAALVVAVGSFTQAFSDGGWVFLLPGGLALLVAAALFGFFIASYNSRQFISVTPERLMVRSRAHGTRTIPWPNLEKVSETPLVIEKVRGILPIIEIMASYYFLLPLPSAGEKRSLLNFEAKDGTRIVLREHLLYPHRVDQLRQAASLYAPATTRTQLILKSNTQN